MIPVILNGVSYADDRFNFVILNVASEASAVKNLRIDLAS